MVIVMIWGAGTGTALNPDHVAVATGNGGAHEGEGIEAGILGVGGRVEEDVVARRGEQDDVEPPVRRDQRAGHAEELDADVDARHSSDAAQRQRRRARHVDDRVDEEGGVGFRWAWVRRSPSVLLLLLLLPAPG